MYYSIKWVGESSFQRASDVALLRDKSHDHLIVSRVVIHSAAFDITNYRYMPVSADSIEGGHKLCLNGKACDCVSTKDERVHPTVLASVVQFAAVDCRD
jgi:hypothetical protein